ncbi:glycosyltransferase family 4 protein [Flavobacteriaceae bacterium]|nr:glycosyltransferase family 4 protein [Flavobacteriaceae bacterium]
MINKKTTIVHQLTFAAIGGIQNSFIPLYKLFNQKSSFNHLIYGTHRVIPHYLEIERNYSNFGGSLFKKLKFIYFLISKKYIVHFYNTLTSKNIYLLFKLLPVNNVIIHERGSSWNSKNSDSYIAKYLCRKSSLILANSHASKALLVEKFKLDQNKIQVIHNGFLSKDFFIDPINNKKSIKFSVGFIGRLESQKGIHILINSAKKLPNINFYIAGEGPMLEYLEKLALGLSNVFFVGVKNPINFMGSVDILVVPSIREPLGNVIIEAGFCKKAVIASNIDGIPEIIINNISGILLTPREPISLNDIPLNATPLPEFVVNPNTMKLQMPLELNCDDLVNAIEKLRNNPLLRLDFGKSLNETVLEKFTLEKYFNNIHKIYESL